ncbi:MAG: gyrase subunit A protein [Parcubacteria group bacterium GW2011_GWF2_46_8]|nr:MAG: gyrase subunit A protein [Parcubacteria group bacterium GW2011_GWF2_46_8]
MPRIPIHKQEETVSRESVSPREITQEMRESYLAYAMSVIVSRALPDVRDGLKPVQRRILYAMNEMGLRHGAKTVKSARVVGEVMGKYHPHGNLAIYDALVRMAQKFSYRYPLVTGQGNFGSVDGDPPAAERYTEAKLSVYADALLEDIEKETVAFRQNYDNTRTEPAVLPTRIPNLLVNGSVGIAVGMATNIPPHNLTEVCGALEHLLSHPDATTEQLLEYIQGPDFPTGGIIFNRDDITTAYSTGKGSLVTRGRAEVVERAKKKGEYDIVITEIPYEVNKATLIEKIAALVEDKKFEGIRDIRDESDKDGLRVVIELKSSAQPQRLLNQLFHYTDLEKTYHMNLLALVDGIQPQTLSLKEILAAFLEHRKNVVSRRTAFDLAKTKERIHILEGLARALDHLDAIIKIIRGAVSREAAKKSLMATFKFSDQQTEAILLMRLESLAKLERQKILDELVIKQRMAKEFQEILDTPKKLLSVVGTEIKEIQTAYGDKRKTEIIRSEKKELREEELVSEKQVIVALSQSDYIKRIEQDVFRVQKRGGKGVAGFETKSDEDVLRMVAACSTHDTLFLLTNSGKLFFSRVYDLPEATRTSRGKPVNNFVGITAQESIATFIAYPHNTSLQQFSHLLLVTKMGVIKKLPLQDIMGSVRSGIRVLNLRKDDELIAAQFIGSDNECIIVSAHGQLIRFPGNQVKAQGRVAQGVKGMELREHDYVVGMGVARAEKGKTNNLLVVTRAGFGKQSLLSEYRIQKRGGIGIKATQVTEKTGNLTGAFVVTNQEEAFLASRAGQTIRMSLNTIPIQGRSTQGVHLMRLDQGDEVTGTSCV